jgi:hypothetical protein
MYEIRVTRTDGRQLTVPVGETDDAPSVAERIAKRVNNVRLSGTDGLVELRRGKYVLASQVAQVWVIRDGQPQTPPA